jgi:AcrR family transcriptional regulator
LTKPLLVGKPTNMQENSADRRLDIIQAGLAVLREHGFAGFTQPRVAAVAGVRQSHLTYYFPTRVDLLTAVAHAATERLLATVDSIVEVSTPKAAAARMASVMVRRENTRVLMALVQVADQEPALRELFRELADGILVRFGKLLTNLKVKATDEHCYLVHALSVGMAVIYLATAREDGERRSARTMEIALRLLKKEAGK